MSDNKELPDAEKSNPWKKLSSDVVYDNNWITVKDQKVITPGGREGIYGKVTFKNRAVGIIPVDEKGNTWIVGQYRYTLDEYSWEIPEGGCPPEEDVLNAAKRELKEETGLVAGKWECIMKLHTSNSVTDEIAFIFLAESLSQEEPQPEDTEKLTVKKLPFRDVVDMAMNGEITDAMSVAGILKLAMIKEKSGISV